MRVTINGEDRKLEHSMTVEQLLGDMGLDGRKVAVERNLEIAPKSNYAATPVADGDRLASAAQHFGGDRRRVGQFVELAADVRPAESEPDLLAPPLAAE